MLYTIAVLASAVEIDRSVLRVKILKCSINLSKADTMKNYSEIKHGNADY